MEADVGILMAGAVTVAIYPTLRADAVDYILRDSGARVLFADDPPQVEKLLVNGLPDALEVVVVFDETVRFDVPDDQGRLELTLADVVPEDQRARFVPYSTFLERGGEHLEACEGELSERARAIGPDSRATLVYTSGTGGRPKGVVLSHGNLVFEARAIHEVLPLGERDVQLLFLPLAHILARQTIFLQMVVGFTTAFSSQILRVMDDCGEVRPTVIVSVPRLYEKFYETARNTLEASGEMKQRVWQWAFGVGRTVAEKRSQGAAPRGLLSLSHRYADRLVFRPIHRRLGGRIRFMISGAAPLPAEVAEFFHAAGLPLLEGYGLTETSGAATLNRLADYRVGTVGEPVPGVEVRIAEDGEVLVRGGNVMVGYHGAAEETHVALSEGRLAAHRGTSVGSMTGF